MRTAELIEYVRELTGRTLQPMTLLRWEDKGLIGDIPRTDGGHREYSDINMKRVILISILHNLGWKLLHISKLLYGDMDMRMKLASLITKYKIKALPKLEELISEEVFSQIKLQGDDNDGSKSICGSEV